MEIRELRSRAEHALRVTRREVRELSPTDVQALVHELQVHQVELEMQNEALRAAQDELETSHAQYQELFECAPIGYISLSAAGLITRANEVSGALLGIAGMRLVGMSLDKLLAPQHRAEYQRIMTNVDIGARAQLEIRAAADHTRYLRLDVTRAAGGTSGWLVALTDVSPQKLHLDALASSAQALEERVIERTAELTQRNLELEHEIAARTESEQKQRALEARLRETERFESLGLLAGGLAHDFNNLLVGVMGNADLLRLRPELDESCHQFISLILKASRQALGLTRQLLILAGKGQLSMAPLNLPKAIAENLELLRTRVPPDVQLQVRIGGTVPDICADRAQISQLLLDLLTNALEAVDGSGAITVEASEQQLSEEALAAFEYAQGAQPGRFAVLRLSDSGQGMDAETLARIFDPFFSTKFTGRGLGLATVRGIVQSHRGAIQVHSEVGNGSCFEVALPAAEATRESDNAPPTAARPWRGSGPILLVDDDNAVRSVLAKLLSVMGFDVTEARGGSEALELFRRGQPRFKLVVLDWIMPGMTGRQTLEALRELTPELPVILVSGYNPEDLGTYDSRVVCIQKPMTLTQLREAACSLLGSGEAPHAAKLN